MKNTKTKLKHTVHTHIQTTKTKEVVLYYPSILKFG